MSKKKPARRPAPRAPGPAPHAPAPSPQPPAPAQGAELLRQGARLLAQNQPAEAAARLEQAAALLPDDPDVAINLGGAYILLRRYNKAVAVLERASLLAPDNPMVWTNLAAGYLGSLELSGPEQQSKAIAAYQRALDADPTTPHVHYNLGLIHHDRRDHAQAAHWFGRALELNPHDHDARQWLARLARLADASDAQPAGAEPVEAAEPR
jgi:tetratricopeptide (TPR) repeat protein